MSQQLQKSYPFYSDNLNIGKYDLLYKKAVQLRDFKNSISTEVCSNPINFFNISKFDWINYFRTKLDYSNNQDISNAISDTFVGYENKITAFKRNSVSKIQKELKYSYYKVNTKNNKNSILSC